MKHDSHTAALLLGSNIQPERYLPLALRYLSQRFRIHSVSSVWESPAVGGAGSNFLNAVCVLSCDLSPEKLKTQILRPLEAKLGRVRGADKFAPRTIDIDIIVWDGEILDHDVWRYAHVAVPLAEVLDSTLSPLSNGEILTASNQFLKTSPIRRRVDVLLSPSVALGNILTRQSDESLQRHSAGILTAS